MLKKNNMKVTLNYRFALEHLLGGISGYTERTILFNEMECARMQNPVFINPALSHEV